VNQSLQFHIQEELFGVKLESMVQFLIFGSQFPYTIPLGVTGSFREELSGFCAQVNSLISNHLYKSLTANEISGLEFTQSELALSIFPAFIAGQNLSIFTVY